MSYSPNEAARQAQDSLHQSIQGLVARTSDAGRVARIGVLCPSLAHAALPLVLAKQRHDGGWVDVEDTIWCASVLTLSRQKTESLDSATRWLGAHRTAGGAWGRNERDEPRLPLSAIALRFLAESAAESSDWARLDSLWSADLDSNVRLSYKGGFYLCCQPLDASSALIDRTVDYLIHEMNSDGGYAPWKGHVIGSDPWSTGVCLAGLCRFPGCAGPHVIERALRWLVENQLPSGYWRYHFIDEGSAYAYWGITEALSALEGL